jgi:hypothetical protein
MSYSVTNESREAGHEVIGSIWKSTSYKARKELGRSTRRSLDISTTLTALTTGRYSSGICTTMSQNEFIPKYTHPFTLEEAMLLEIDILVQGKLQLIICSIHCQPGSAVALTESSLDKG